MNVLLLGRRRDLEPSIVETLERAGHSVQFPGTREEALIALNRRAFDCVVLSYSLSNTTIEEFIELLKQTSPTCPIIAISENSGMDCKLEPSRMLQLRQGPEVLISTLAVIERRARASEYDQAQVIGSKTRAKKVER
jgi:CheY-like chemotaxis protein